MAATTHERRPAPRQAAGGGLPGAIAAEWTKLWGLRSTWLCLAVAVLATGGTALLAALALNAGDSTETLPVNALATTSVLLSQFALVAVAALTVTGEYATGAMRTTLTTVPDRARMLLAKAAVLAVAVSVTGLVAGASSIAATAGVFGDAAVFETAYVVHGTVGTAGYLLAVSLFTLGLGLVMRSTAGAITTAVAVLMAIPMISQMIGDETVTRIVDHLPATAGMPLMIGVDNPYGWGTGALLLAGWAALALAAGYAVLSRRDA
ncbi:ABC transporter permease [Streptomonospora sp. PA3]|uniref:ABC transporter permease n=1 Tax=Streptomonospora sp. PA3 TaxID=2607326 RepID=UPI0012DFDA09|nr:ABC transporter permease [Streptomonospora sp. PA3]MUL42941.1 ABC transporter permease [Streptomonospora sp. PA3]